jgi:hypothetical protein
MGGPISALDEFPPDEQPSGQRLYEAWRRLKQDGVVETQAELARYYHYSRQRVNSTIKRYESGEGEAPASAWPFRVAVVHSHDNNNVHFICRALRDYMNGESVDTLEERYALSLKEMLDELNYVICYDALNGFGVRTRTREDRKRVQAGYFVAA